jgi:hypothetical protein
MCACVLDIMSTDHLSTDYVYPCIRFIADPKSAVLKVDAATAQNPPPALSKSEQAGLQARLAAHPADLPIHEEQRVLKQLKFTDVVSSVLFPFPRFLCRCRELSCTGV